MTKHLIRQATLADLNFVLTCSQLLADEEHAMNPKVHNEKDNPHEAYLQSVLAGEQSDAFVLRCDHCGCLVVNVNHNKKTIYLSELYVLPQFRSQGIASKLIDYVKAYRDKNYPDYSIRLNCLRENNVAQACYEHNGFNIFRKDRWGVLYEYPVENEMNKTLKNFSNIVKKYFSSTSEKIFIIDYMADPDSYENVYVDMDDTCILWNHFCANTALLDFLKVSKERGKTLHLVTRADNADYCFKMFNLNVNDVFDYTNSVGDELKSLYCPAPGIFIDDKEKERAEVTANAGIASFDPETPVFRRLSSWPDNGAIALKTMGLV